MSIAGDNRSAFAFSDEATRRAVESLCNVPGRPCWPMLVDPAFTLAHREYWPDHLCGPVIEKALQNWAGHRLGGRRELTAVEKWWTYGLPLPVGEESIARHFRPPAPAITPGDVERLAVFPGDEAAWFIATLTAGETTVEAFFLAGAPAKKVYLERAGARLMSKVAGAPVQFRTAGPDESPDVDAFHKHARAWWNRRPFLPAGRAGKPAGSYAFTRTEIVALVERWYLAEPSRTKRTKEEFAAWLSARRDAGEDVPSMRTVERRLSEDAHTTWRELLATLRR